MKTDRNILVAFLLNFTFAIFEFAGGIFTNSVAIMSDAVHDFSDALSIGMSYFLEKKSMRKADDTHTYGYKRYSVAGSLITTLVLIVGSVFVIINAVNRLVNPVEINYNSMIVFAIIGVCVNMFAALLTHKGDSLNQKAVNLHMLEDVLGWVIVLVGAVIMRFTDLSVIDPIMSIGVSVFILINALKNLKKVIDLFLLKTPHKLSVQKVKEEISKIEGVDDVHHIHLWSIDSFDIYATMHIVTDYDAKKIKSAVKEKLKDLKVVHSTIEIEKCDEGCCEHECVIHNDHHSHHHHHHHH